MVIRLRLARHGVRGKPTYSIVAIQARKARNAQPIEQIGTYDPLPVLTYPRPTSLLDRRKAEDGVWEKKLELNAQRASWWISVGAQPSKTVAKLLLLSGLTKPGQFNIGGMRTDIASPSRETETPSKSSVIGQATTGSPNPQAGPSSPLPPAQVHQPIDTAPNEAASASNRVFQETYKPHKPSARARARERSRNFTLSIALPGSILLNAQTPELRTILAGQIARSCAIFNVDEIIVFHEPTFSPSSENGHEQKRMRGKYRQTAEEESQSTAQADEMLVKILTYLETPQYLRKALIPMHSALRQAGILPPLDMPHHLRRDDPSPFREAVVLSHDDDGRSVQIDIGLRDPVRARTKSSALPERGTRVTAHYTNAEWSLVSPLLPRELLGISWGYRVRHVSQISRIFLDPAHGQPNEEYDLVIGTSERGQPLQSALDSFPPHPKHVLIVLGGLAGLELTIGADEDTGLTAETALDLFDHWINLCPHQGSRTIRSEEALPIALATLAPYLDSI
ncbi:uncharacterized protein L969DRAFT_18362 [Mixia osmundae IAM 14324]|uniref:uncharacterized protein n=1 Tax=Mixia osmundae (strain CBS 9802 / IAM 14324 / JCM 22182 / KY 12970) TaxID=764103 RepID=UPI0004A54990|nr:uncharacterized protein L969DRAFT_18362 [Mixia osmundae IAM 14324]KEI38349.1 hypothetical protein L969DRAFT_18362 [Mixia osmundae IAM 14324]